MPGTNSNGAVCCNPNLDSCTPDDDDMPGDDDDDMPGDDDDDMPDDDDDDDMPDDDDDDMPDDDDDDMMPPAGAFTRAVEHFLSQFLAIAMIAEWPAFTGALTTEGVDEKQAKHQCTLRERSLNTHSTVVANDLPQSTQPCFHWRWPRLGMALL